ncbi:hypothetical protein [Microcoleus sp.]|uniref:hypothetical protein n=1 Tax=Microcoleus sp. TaxID=44472 RepID=UPI00403EE609
MAQTPPLGLVWSSQLAIDQGTALSEVSDFNKITESEIVLHSGAIRLKIVDKF